MGRIVKVDRPVSWRNPLKDFQPAPYLDGPIFPIQRESPSDRKAWATLHRFYVDERLSGEVDSRALQQFLRNPGKHVFVIWGDIGIGKSWFVRYQLHLAAVSQPGQLRYEVIDMLRANRADARERLEQQVVASLEHYLSESFGSWEKGIRPYAEHRAKMRYGPVATAQEINLEAKRNVNEILELRGGARAEALLEVVENVEGPPLFIAIDNLDRALDAEQHALTDLVARMLHNARIYLIFPLRSSSGILLDEGRVLGFFEKQEMHLSALQFRPLLLPRFTYSEAGEDLRHIKIPLSTRDEVDTLTFSALLELFLASKASTFVLDLAGTNARQLLDFVHRITFSNQLDDIRNVSLPEACVAALMMHDSGSFSTELSYLVNLFDDNRPDDAGNALIRLRVLEFFKHSVSVGPNERWLTDYFGRLGYSQQRVLNVVALFVGARLLKTDPVMTAEQIIEAGPVKIGTILRIEANVSQYFDKLLRSPWYFICVKRSIHIDEHLIKKKKDGTESVPDQNLIRFLKEEEDRERVRIGDWEKAHGTKLGKGKPLIQPWALARDAFNSRDRDIGGRSVQTKSMAEDEDQ